jgi:hypothetical protein
MSIVIQMPPNSKGSVTEGSWSGRKHLNQLCFKHFTLQVWMQITMTTHRQDLSQGESLECVSLLGSKACISVTRNRMEFLTL